MSRPRRHHGRPMLRASSASAPIVVAVRHRRRPPARPRRRARGVPWVPVRAKPRRTKGRQRRAPRRCGGGGRWHGHSFPTTTNQYTGGPSTAARHAGPSRLQEHLNDLALISRSRRAARPEPPRRSVRRAATAAEARQALAPRGVRRAHPDAEGRRRPRRWGGDHDARPDGRLPAGLPRPRRIARRSSRTTQLGRTSTPRARRRLPARIGALDE